MPINRTSHPQGLGFRFEVKGRLETEIEDQGSDRNQRERRAAELLLAVRRPSQEQTLARPFFFVLFIIINPRGNPPHHKLE